MTTSPGSPAAGRHTAACDSRLGSGARAGCPPHPGLELPAHANDAEQEREQADALAVDSDDEAQNEHDDELLDEQDASVSSSLSLADDFDLQDATFWDLNDTSSRMRGGSDVDAMNACGDTALMVALQATSADYALAMIRRGADVNAKSYLRCTALMFAARNAHAAAVAELVQRGADIDAKDVNGVTPLMCAACSGHVGIVAELLRHGAYVNERDQHGGTALMIAANRGHGAAAAELVRRGAAVSARDNSGNTALMVALWNKQCDVAMELVRLGADVNEKNESGATALMYAAQQGHVAMVAELIRLGADMDAANREGATAVILAADERRSDVIAELARLGADVNAVDKDGRTAGMIAVQLECVDAALALSRAGVSVDTVDSDSRTALMIAAQEARIDAVAELIRLGASLDAKDCGGKTALMYAAVAGGVDVIAALIRAGADTDVKDSDGKTARELASELWRKDVVEALLQVAEFDSLSPSSDDIALFVAAVMGDVISIRALVDKSVDLNLATRDGRTVLFCVLESLLQQPVELVGSSSLVQLLIDRGASADVKVRSKSAAARECETPLTAAGRAGHMQIFEALVAAGAPVNVRSPATDGEGETPLLSVARCDYFPAVRRLIERGGSGTVCFKDVRDDEYPLLLGSLATMTTMCATVTFEFEPVCVRMVARLRAVCSKLEELAQSQSVPRTDSAAALAAATAVSHGDVDSADIPLGIELRDALVSYAGIVYRASRLLFLVEKKRSTLSRIVASRALLQRIKDVDDELGSFARLHSLQPSDGDGVAGDDDVVREQLQTRFQQALSADDFDAFDSKRGTAVLLQHELDLHRRQPNQRSQVQASILETVLARFLLKHRMVAPTVPVWFIPRDDLDIHSWSCVDNDIWVDRYEGTWCGANVEIEVNRTSSDTVEVTAAKWCDLRHPNIVEVYGACHDGSSSLLVYESTPGALPLHEFLRVSKASCALTWKLLYDAALGLQYLHSRDVVHGRLRSETIVVGSDSVARVSSIGGDAWLLDLIDWEAPEQQQSGSSSTSALDVYALGMCIAEAVALASPTSVGVQGGRPKAGDLPERPAGVRDREWELISAMCAHDPSERLTIDSVVKQLEQFVLKRMQAVSGDDTSDEQSSARVAREANLTSQRIDKHWFAELGRTIPKALECISTRCKSLPDAQWLLSSALPALEFVVGLLQERAMTPVDAEVVALCGTLARLQRYVRTACSDMSVYQQIRSLRAVESHGLVYAELDRLLDMLHVFDEHAIRVWRHEVASSIAGVEVSGGSGTDHGAVGSDIDVSGSSPSQSTQPQNARPSPSHSDAIALNHLDTPLDTYEQWTREGLAKTAAAAPSTWRPAWYLSLREVVFSEADKLGQGAFGAVYRGTWNNARVVIKFMGYEDDIKTISTELLLHEVRVWHRLSHPHVLKLYGASHVSKRYFVCEFAGNGELTTFLKKPGNQHLVWQKLHEAALGLQYLHSVGVAHNDLKCDNIMIGLDNKAKLIDFGLSCLLGEAEVQIDVKKIGAVNWRSPEYLAGKRPSRASDVYSFAMCIIETVSGGVPWGPHMLAPAIKFHVKKGKLPALPGSMTPKQRNLIELMVKLEPSERVTMTFVVNKLQEIAHDERASRGSQACSGP